MSDPAELRAGIANVIRAHALEDGRCVACGQLATHQSMHQADAVLAALREKIMPVMEELEADLTARTNECDAATINFAPVAASASRLIGAKRVLEALGIELPDAVEVREAK